MSAKRCRICSREKPAAAFLAGKAQRESSACADCRQRRANQHRKRYFASLSADKRHEITHRRRAADAGVRHEPYSRTEILVRWGGRCAYCDHLAEHLDHVLALSRGGDDIESNILPACADCNLSKGAKTLAEWAESFGPDETLRCFGCGEYNQRGCVDGRCAIGGI